MSAREVYLAADPVNAEIMKDVLASHGISAHVRRAHLWSGMGELPANLYPGVWIDNDLEYSRARALVDEFERGPATRGRPWQCPQCKEWLDGQFQACWNCQHVRRDDD